MPFDLTLTAPTFVASTFGQALSNSFGKTTTKPTVTSTDNWAMRVTAKASGITVGPKIMAGQTGVFWLALNGNGALECHYGGSAEVTMILAGVRWDDGAYHEFELNFDGSGARVYIDGVLKASNAKTMTQAGPSASPGQVFIGNFEGTAGYTWPGEIDQAAIFSAAQHAAAYTPTGTAVPTNAAQLVALWDMNGNGLDTAGQVADTTPPTISAAAVANSTPTIVALTASENLDGANVPAASAFTIAGHTVTGVAISGTVINLTVTPAFVNGEAARMVGYTQPGTANARDVAGNLLANFTGLAITNNVAAADTVPPAFASAQVTNSQPSVILVTMNETLAASVPPASAFAASGGRTVTGVSITGAVASVTVSAAYTSSDTITIAYTQPGANPRLQDAAGNLTATFAAQPVTNNIAASTGSNALVNSTGKVLFSPLNWNVGASSAKTINAGAAFRTIFGGTSCTLTFDVSTLVAPFPEVRYRVDRYGPWITQTLAASITVTVPTDTADYANKPGHLLEFEVKSTTETQNRWPGTSNMVSLTGIALDAGKALSLPPARPLRGLFYGDSITEGCRTVKALGTPDTASHDAALSWPSEVARLLGAECGLVGFSATGWNTGGVGGVPSMGNNWNLLYSGVSRSFTNAPDFIVIAHGHNDGTVSSTTTQTNVLNGLLAATPSTTHIFLVRPLSVPEQGAYMQAAIAACNAPSRCHYIDTAGFFTSADSSDNVHPYGVENVTHIAPLVAAQIRPVLMNTAPAAPTTTTRTFSVSLATGLDANSNPIPAASLTGLKVRCYNVDGSLCYSTDAGASDANGVVTVVAQSTAAAGASCLMTVRNADHNYSNFVQVS